MIGKKSQKLQEHIIVLKEKEAYLALWVEKLMKQNWLLLEIGKEKEVEYEALRK